MKLGGFMGTCMLHVAFPRGAYRFREKGLLLPWRGSIENQPWWDRQRIVHWFFVAERATCHRLVWGELRGGSMVPLVGQNLETHSKTSKPASNLQKDQAGRVEEGTSGNGLSFLHAMPGRLSMLWSIHSLFHRFSIGSWSSVGSSFLWSSEVLSFFQVSVLLILLGCCGVWSSRNKLGNHKPFSIIEALVRYLIKSVTLWFKQWVN